MNAFINTDFPGDVASAMAMDACFLIIAAARCFSLAEWSVENDLLVPFVVTCDSFSNAATLRMPSGLANFWMDA